MSYSSCATHWNIFFSEDGKVEFLIKSWAWRIGSLLQKMRKINTKLEIYVEYFIKELNKTVNYRDQYFTCSQTQTPMLAQTFNKEDENFILGEDVPELPLN